MMNVKIHLNGAKINQKVTNKRFGKFAALEWKRLIDPYTPRDTGTLESNVDILPFRLHYRQEYAARQYYGRGFRFRKKNPYATSEWDKAAEKAGQKSKLYRALNGALRNGIY